MNTSHLALVLFTFWGLIIVIEGVKMYREAKRLNVTYSQFREWSKRK